jgi:YVTN family beta-propeller protein
VPTAQLIHAAGDSVEIAGRPVDIVLSPDGDLAIAKDNRGLVVLDARTWRLKQELGIPRKGGSMTGLAVSADGRRVVVSDAGVRLHVAEFNETGTLAWTKAIDMPKAEVGGSAFPCGVALLPGDQRVLACLSRGNAVAIVDLETGAVEGVIPVGVAPFEVVVSADGSRAWVTNRGGRRAVEGDKTAASAGTPTVIDDRGIASTGSVSVLDLSARSVATEIPVGLSPGGLALSPDGRTLYVANSNSDTLSIIDTGSDRVTATVTIRPDESLPFGSMPSAVAVSPDGLRVYVTCAGNNAVAVVDAASVGHDAVAGVMMADRPTILGWIPTGWYPGAVVAEGNTLYIANIKGVGSRSKRQKQAGWNSHWHRGTLQRVPVPTRRELAALTQRVLADARVPETLRSLERSEADAEPVPVPAVAGQPSVFEHVVYIVKENRTYDQVFGDLPKGNGDPSLCIYGEEVTPNQHAMAKRWATLDNFYCNGVLSADGHSWATEGDVTPYLERSFGGFARSYTFGDDPLTYSSSGFIWDHVLAAGLSFRNYGEFDYAKIVPKGNYFDVYRDWKDEGGRYTFTQTIGVENVRRYTCPDAPGWNMDIPDQIRADAFLRELDGYERDGTFPSFVFLYLPNDHTSGTSPGHPTPRALVADNDLALGRVIEGLSHSRFWKTTCVFVIEDDPQNGFDHVDGHRSTCLVVSPYTKRGEVVSAFYNQASVFHTIERILGINPANQMYALAPVMTACFTDEPDLTPYDALPNRIPLDEANPSAEGLHGLARELAEASTEMDFTVFDAVDEDLLNRVLWHAAKGVDAPYPVALAGAHGKGLAKLGLRLAGPGEWAGQVIDDDDD